MRQALRIEIQGIVQGVGFRPFVYRVALQNHIAGWVLNATAGVTVHAEGEEEDLNAFVMQVHDDAPAAAQIKCMNLEEVAPRGFEGFEIRLSSDAAAQKTTLVSADLATCPECERELFDPSNRRYRYPFINCTNCGPRFTILEKLPYDRPQTSMRPFDMCPSCAAEYANPLDRRFHAQPDACWDCGPVVSFGTGPQDMTAGSTREASDALFAQAVALLQEGKILAVKGLGGFHLVCDAQNPAALAELRARKHREGKPFAVMMSSVEDVRRVCLVNDEEEAILTGSARPIVLLRKRPDAVFAAGLADDLTELGVMLPYTPVQHLLMHDFAAAGGSMLVMTSGNVHDEPIVTTDEDAFLHLGGIADAFLTNNRAILSRYDDSVVRILDFGPQIGTALQFVRRARGYAPVPLQVNAAFAAPEDTTVLAVGPEQKSTLCFMREGEAFVSQHIGDRESASIDDAWFEVQHRFEQLFEVKPSLLACDKHPEYLATKWARQQDLPRVEAQHHHAHIVSALAENGLEEAALGFAFDGTGYGVDGAIWGGEALLCNTAAFERFANFVYVPMPGGAAAVKHPLRMAYGVLWAYDLLEHPAAVAVLEPLGATGQLLGQMIEQGINTPFTSSVGRLFDAASALLGICPEPKYEGEGAILLEAAVSRTPSSGLPAAPVAPAASRSQVRHGLDARESDARETAACHDCRTPSSGLPAAPVAPAASKPDPRYAIAITKNIATEQSTAQDTSVLLFDAAPTFGALLDDLQAGVPVGLIAQHFHDAFVEAIVTMAELFRSLYGLSTIALSGGVFMNRYLVEHVVPLLAEHGFTVALNKELPPNDGCISFGQAVIACATTREKNK